MKLDTSSYYPKSLLDDDNDEEAEVTGVVSAEVTPDAERQSVVVVEEREVVAGVAVEDEAKAALGSEPEKPETSFEKGVSLCSNIISWVLVPLLMPVYGMLLAFNLSLLSFTPLRAKCVFTLITFGICVVVPMLIVLLLKRAGKVEDIGLNGRKERLVPYIISIVALGVTGLFMWYKGAPMWLVMFFEGGAAAGLVNLLINFRWKISAHAAGIAGVVALLIRIIRDGYPMGGAFTWLLVVIALAGVLGSARVWLGRHTVWQVLAGYAVGFLGVILMTLIK